VNAVAVGDLREFLPGAEHATDAEVEVALGRIVVEEADHLVRGVLAEDDQAGQLLAGVPGPVDQHPLAAALPVDANLHRGRLGGDPTQGHGRDGAEGDGPRQPGREVGVRRDEGESRDDRRGRGHAREQREFQVTAHPVAAPVELGHPPDHEVHRDGQERVAPHSRPLHPMEVEDQSYP